MRTLLGAVALLLGAAAAQAQSASQFFPTGSRPSLAFGAAGPIVNQPINTRLAIAPFQTSPGYLQGFFRTVTLGAWPPTTATSPLPPPSAFPSTKYPNTFKPRLPIKSLK